eukprot:3045641-Prymnesium_polylepis.1
MLADSIEELLHVEPLAVACPVRAASFKADGRTDRCGADTGHFGELHAGEALQVAVSGEDTRVVHGARQQLGLGTLEPVEQPRRAAGLLRGLNAEAARDCIHVD